jgi:hypothetical protein
MEILVTLLIALVVAIIVKLCVDIFAPQYSAPAALVAFLLVILARWGVL